MLKYEVAVNLISGMICWVHGGCPGKVHDLTLAGSAFLQQLLPGERVFADKIYTGCASFLVAHKGRLEHLTPEQQQWNNYHTLVHFEHIERVNRRLKIWKSMKKEWRHSLLLHSYSFNVIAKLTNVELAFYPLNQ